MSSFKEFTPDRTATRNRATRNPARLLAAHAVDAVLEKKGHDVVVMDMRQVSGVADYFVICTGDSDLQIRAIVDAVEARLKAECGERPWHREGREHLQWVLLDYVDLVVHVFNPERREFYSLERLWGDAPNEHVPDDASAADVALLQEKAKRKSTVKDRQAEE